MGMRFVDFEANTFLFKEGLKEVCKVIPEDKVDCPRCGCPVRRPINISTGAAREFSIILDRLHRYSVEVGAFQWDLAALKAQIAIAVASRQEVSDD